MTSGKGTSNTKLARKESLLSEPACFSILPASAERRHHDRQNGRLDTKEAEVIAIVC